MTERIRGVSCLQRGMELLEIFKLAGKLNQKPSSLSGGEKQRVALAQALMFDPQIVLADEPTAGLDDASSIIVSETLKEYAILKSAVVLVATHDMPVMQLSHYVRNVSE